MRVLVCQIYNITSNTTGNFGFVRFDHEDSSPLKEKSKVFKYVK